MSKKGKIIIAGVLILFIAILVIVNIQKSSGKTYTVSVEKVERGKLIHKVSGTGKIQPEVAVKISANVSARIIRIHAKEGERVKKDQILVELDRTRYEAAVVQARANLSSAEATSRQQKASMEQANSAYKRMEKLFEQGLSSQEESESAKTQYDVAKARYEAAQDQVTQAEALLEQAKDDLAKTTIHSPINGVVTQLNREEGEIALGSQFQEDVIMVVSDLSNMEAVVEVDENDVVDVSIGDSSEIRIDAFPDTVFWGTVSEIAHTATTKGLGTQEEVINFEVKVAVLNKIENIRPGMSANVDIITDVHNSTLKVPIQAVTVREKREIERTSGSNDKNHSQDQKSDTLKKEETSPLFGDESELQEVLFVVKDNMAEIRPVKTGIIGDTYIEILDGVKEDETVVTGSYRILSKDLANGSNVKIEKKRKFQSRAQESE